MSDDRSETLREVRNRSKERAQKAAESETDETDEPSESSQPSETAETDGPSGGAGTDERAEGGTSKLSGTSGTGETSDLSETVNMSVKDEQESVYMYLPADQKKELERLYKLISAEYEYEFDDEFEKNRHFYPLVVQNGLNELDDLTPAEVRDRLQDLD